MNGCIMVGANVRDAFLVSTGITGRREVTTDHSLEHVSQPNVYST